MLEVTVGINRKLTLAQLHAVRTKPKSDKIKNGTICTYDIVYDNTTVDAMQGAYGCGVDLAIQLLEKWKKNSETYKLKSILKKIGEHDE